MKRSVDLCAQVCRENCTDGVDNTDNGLVDCKDPDCEKNVACMEKCEDGTDNTGDGLVDCADPDCKETLVCRKEIPKSLDLYVMSFCPYGIKAEAGLKEVLANFGANMKFKLHFITSVLDEKGYQDFPRKQWCEKYPDGNYYCSMHGKEETDENLRQICAGDRAQDVHGLRVVQEREPARPGLEEVRHGRPAWHTGRVGGANGDGGRFDRVRHRQQWEGRT